MRPIETDGVGGVDEYALILPASEIKLDFFSGLLLVFQCSSDSTGIGLGLVDGPGILLVVREQ